MESALNIEIEQRVAQVAQVLLQRRLMLVTAESCTGGGVAQALTELAGSSAWFERGFVTYSNRSKQEMLGVDAALIEHHGAVSLEVVEAMALGALAHSAAQISLAISGVAGPTGGTQQKPVGTVCFSWAIDKINLRSELIVFKGNRRLIREQAIVHSLQGLLLTLERSFVAE